jgi:hypothetical protein
MQKSALVDRNCLLPRSWFYSVINRYKLWPKIKYKKMQFKRVLIRWHNISSQWDVDLTTNEV